MSDLIDSDDGLHDMKTAFRLLGLSAVDAASSFDEVDRAMRDFLRSMHEFYDFLRPRWYNRLRWQLDASVRRRLSFISQRRSTRRLRVYIERVVRELEGYEVL